MKNTWKLTILSSLWGKWRTAWEVKNKLILGDFRRAEALPRAMIHDLWSISSCSKLTWELPGLWGNLSGTGVLPTEQGTSSPNGTMTPANASRGRNCDPCTKGPLQGCPSQLEGAGWGSSACSVAEPLGAREKGSDGWMGSNAPRLKNHLLPRLLRDAAAVNVLPLRDWVSPVTWISQGCTDKGKRLCIKCPTSVWQRFSGVIPPFSTPISATAGIHSQQNTTGPTWAGCSPGFPEILIPKEAACLWGEPSCHRPGTQAGEGGGLPHLCKSSGPFKPR